MMRAGRSTAASVAAVTLAALAACASVGEAAPEAVPRFHGIGSLLLVRGARGRGAKDAIDGLDESLRGRGFTTRIAELGRDGGPDQATLERLFRTLELRASSSGADAVTPVRDRDRDAGPLVARLGVDAVVTYHRFERIRAEPPSPSPLLPDTGMPSVVPPPRPPLGALVLVNRAGDIATFAWGGAAELEDSGRPSNAAEAIELLVRTLTGAAEE